MKRCSRCGVEKDESEFGKCSRAKDGLSWWCKACKSEYNRSWHEDNKGRLVEYWREHKRKWYQRYKDRIIKENTTYSTIRRIAHHDLLDTYKTDCVKCGETRHYLIDFHHIDPMTKQFNISNRLTFSVDVLREEVEKCVCLCRNCHKEFHWFYGNKPKTPVESLSEYLEVDVNEI